MRTSHVVCGPASILLFSTRQSYIRLVSDRADWTPEFTKNAAGSPAACGGEEGGKFSLPWGRENIRLKEIIREICAKYDWEIEALEVMVDHVHLCVSCPPRYAPAQVMNTLKRLTARALYAEFPRLKKVQWGGRVWADGYYVGSSGEHATSDLIRHYIEYQKAEESGPKQLRLFDTPPARPARPKRAPR